MKSECIILIGGRNVGTIHSLHLDWPHFLGDFELSPLFDSFKELFASIHACSKEQRYDERDLYWSRLFGLGVEIWSLENEFLFKRKGSPDPKDIGNMFINNNGISFRIFSGGNRVPKLSGILGEAR
jgi:hypothetical protein